MITILVLEDSTGWWKALIAEGDYTSKGHTRAEAIGNLVNNHQDVFDIDVKEVQFE